MVLFDALSNTMNAPSFDCVDFLNVAASRIFQPVKRHRSRTDISLKTSSLNHPGGATGHTCRRVTAMSLMWNMPGDRMHQCSV